MDIHILFALRLPQFKFLEKWIQHNIEKFSCTEYCDYNAIYYSWFSNFLYVLCNAMLQLPSDILLCFIYKFHCFANGSRNLSSCPIPIIIVKNELANDKKLIMCAGGHRCSEKWIWYNYTIYPNFYSLWDQFVPSDQRYCRQYTSWFDSNLIKLVKRNLHCLKNINIHLISKLFRNSGVFVAK